MKIKIINRDIIVKTKRHSIEFIHNCSRYKPNWEAFNTGKHKYIHIGKHVLAIHKVRRQNEHQAG